MGIICEKLVISLNTARFHTKNIYAKLGVHFWQELIDMAESFEPARSFECKKPRRVVKGCGGVLTSDSLWEWHRNKVCGRLSPSVFNG